MDVINAIIVGMIFIWMERRFVPPAAAMSLDGWGDSIGGGNLKRVVYDACLLACSSRLPALLALPFDGFNLNTVFYNAAIVLVG